MTKPGTQQTSQHSSLTASHPHLLRGEALFGNPLQQGHGCGAAIGLAGMAAQVKLS